MTCKERYMKEHPECEVFNSYNYYTDCPHNYGYAADNCEQFGNCEACWDQPAIGVTADDVEEKTWDCDTCVHQQGVVTTFTDGSDSIIDSVCGCGNSIGVSCKNIAACDKYKKRDSSPSKNYSKTGEKIGECIKEGIVKGMQDVAKASEGSPIKDLAKAISDIEKCQIKDSGERRQFETGAVRDIQEGKGRCDLLPLDVVSNLLPLPNQRQILREIEYFKERGDERNLFTVLLHFANTQVETCHVLLEVSKHFEEGAKKYGEYNWQRGIPTHCYIDSAVRHYLKYLRGDTDEPHDRAFVWNILCCIWTCIHKPELNDYRKAEEDV